MTILFIAYTVAWVLACVFALVLCMRNRTQFALVDYWRFLFTPWKVVIFSIALLGMVWLGPKSGDPTWDWVDATFMSVLTFLGAPWTIGILWRSLRRRVAWWQTYIAGCLWMFTTSWSYDLYIVLRDGVYPPSWLANMAASSILYLLAGLLWNLEWSAMQGATLAFLHEGWPHPNRDRSSLRVLLLSVPIILVVVVLMLGFFLHRH
jgi:hypothetical protein